MITADQERVAVLIVRLWREGDDPSALRARITCVPDLDGAPEMVAVAAGRDEILASAGKWLEALTRL